MHAVSFSEPGPPEVLIWQNVPDPVPTPREVLIRIAAAGVNNADLLQRQGRYPVPSNASPILGLECSGEIIGIGSEVGEWKLGDRVCALLNGGGYAEQVAVSADLVLPLPHGVDLIDAAGLPEAACTVYSNMSMVANLCSGMHVLIHGGGSGIGTFAIQWAKALQCKVIVTVGSDEKGKRAEDLGADTVLNYKTSNFVDGVLAATNGNGADIILDLVGVDYFERNFTCLAIDGHIVIIGRTGSATDAVLNLAQLMSKRASVSGTMLRARPHVQKSAVIAGVRQHIWPAIDSGKIRPVIDTILPMSDASAAHRHLAEGKTFGKILLRQTDLQRV
jgi:putative PIG3 family NAD(P)H quinone oxidoreductase